MKFARYTSLTGHETAPARRCVGNSGPEIVFAPDTKGGVFAGERGKWVGEINPARIADYHVGKLAVISGISVEDAARLAEGDLSVLEGLVSQNDEGAIRGNSEVKLHISNGHYSEPRPNMITPISRLEDHLSGEGPDFSAVPVDSLQEFLPVVQPLGTKPTL